MDRLKNLDLFVLDNSLRETTVGALHAHTMENKRKIYDEIKKCGFKYFIVESFNSQTRLGDLFLQQLIKEGEDLRNAFCFSDLWDTISNGVPTHDVSIGMRKCKKYGMHNIILEIDLNYYKIDYVNKFTMKKAIQYFQDKYDWCRMNLSTDYIKPKILLNFRDFSATMMNHPERVEQFITYLSQLPPEKRIFGILYEDLGQCLPSDLANWTTAMRNEMDRGGWTDGHLLFHQHEQWGLMHSSNLEVLGAGANGMWAGVCTEGAALGHADSTTTILNLIRVGNTKVQEKYHCQYLYKAARNVTEVVTKSLPADRQPIYGKRAVDMIFGFVFSDPSFKGGFDMAKFFGVESEITINSLASPAMILLKLQKRFGDNEQFSFELAKNMLDQIEKNAADNRKEEYNSDVGLAMLFDQAGGKMTEKMAEIVEKNTSVGEHHKMLIGEVKKMFDEWDSNDGCVDDKISFQNFYDGFMGPYFGCYRCEDSQKALKAINMDGDDGVDWWEFQYFLLWAAREYPDVKTSSELLDIAFRKGIIPSMLDEIADDATEDESQKEQ